MKRMMYGLSLLWCTAGLALAQDFDAVTIKTAHVAGNVYMLEGRGGNIGVSVGPDGLLIVDDQFAPLAEKIKAALRELSEGKLAFVLNTHFHGDHTGGNPEFGKDSTIIAHTNVRKRLSGPQQRRGRTVEPMVKAGLPVITFDESLSIHFNDEEIRAVHHPNAHTDGDIVILFTKSNVVHMGDLFFNGMFPFVDLDHGGDVAGYAAAVASVVERLPPGAKIIPGHGPLAGPDDLKGFDEMLNETIGIVRDAMADGKSLEQIKADGLPDKWTDWGTGFINTERWLETIHRSLARPNRGR